MEPVIPEIHSNTKNMIDFWTFWFSFAMLHVLMQALFTSKMSTQDNRSILTPVLILLSLLFYLMWPDIYHLLTDLMCYSVIVSVLGCLLKKRKKEKRNIIVKEATLTFLYEHQWRYCDWVLNTQPC